ncbi:MAG: 50S ribosome-binding GTPase [Candidatus Freyarchaeota archaeon]|nr:50S ribosome-binding GTPase [Candidatus Jordarchaeia archaeon]MBS7269336.1 50S ribosome-binding GTPase [Candidatus Jordarchaeia archaeon]MBS7278633.1 50S ribosome-binding GTPase [Candidatus Jordarchaeia archaeon]
MPINLNPEAQVALRRLEEAETKEEKIAAIQELLKCMDKHKGTENFVNQLKKRLAKLRAEVEKEKARKYGRTQDFSIKKQGAGQVILVGLTNTGKSTILNYLTGAKAKVGGYPFTTTRPEVGILDFNSVPIQIVESPALFEGCRSSENGPQIFSTVRNADSIVLVIDLSQDVLQQVRVLLGELESAGILLNLNPPPVEVKKTGSGGIQIMGQRFFEGNPEDILNFLRGKRVINAIVRIWGKTTLEDIDLAMNNSVEYKNSIIVATKGDLVGSSESYKRLVDYYGKRFEIYPISIFKEKGIDEFKEGIFKSLGIIRIYTREPGKVVSEKPLVLKKGASVEDVAKRLHVRFIKNFKYARIYGKSVKHEGEKVGLEHILEDNDIIQFYVN